jgi:hypothetical protein
MGKDVDCSHSSRSASRHEDKYDTSRSSRSVKVSQIRRPVREDSQNANGHLNPLNRWRQDKFASFRHPSSGGQSYHNYKDRHRHVQDDDFMDQRRQEREKIGLTGVTQVWGKSPPRSEELVLTVKLYFAETPGYKAPPPPPTSRHKFIFKNNPES